MVYGRHDVCLQTRILYCAFSHDLAASQSEHSQNNSAYPQPLCADADGYEFCNLVHERTVGCHAELLVRCAVPAAKNNETPSRWAKPRMQRSVLQPGWGTLYALLKFAFAVVRWNRFAVQGKMKSDNVKIAGLLQYKL
jgi:hypothetical protein